MLLAMLLHLVQHLAYDYSLHQIISPENFLAGVSASSGRRRLAVLISCGLVGGIGWWLIYRYGRPLVSINKAISAEAPLMPPLTTVSHILLQIVTVALGSPLGREVAPREAGALLGGWMSHYARLAPDQRRLIVACGAGAGLAAVYNVPLGGAVFALEMLIRSLSWSALAAALTASAIAASVAWLGLGAETLYAIPHFPLTTGIIVWAVVTSPLFGIAAYGFVRITTAARNRVVRNNRLPVLAFINYAVIGVLSMDMPALLGNGKGAAQLGFDSTMTITAAAILLVCKMAINTSSVRVGFGGGLLTPGLSNGALLAVVLGGLWNSIWPGGEPTGAYAVIGAAAFLGASMNMPLTAVVLLAEFTRIDHDFLVPIILAVSGAVCVCRLCTRLWDHDSTPGLGGNQAEPG
ncbi:chloride channel protein [Martelella alba]|uniref:Chloride channel protein n=2 Tax=Martelella alba TaxID=2590451 RepID=A0ABY2SG24_9HYPH|nr:chloride channel protein [Martelella alba]